MTLRVVELFAGGGGAHLGIQRAGLQHSLSVERDPHAVATLRAAQRDGLLHDSPVFQGDVADVDRIVGLVGSDAIYGLWASPPCQPHSKAGPRGAGMDTERDGWPPTLNLIDWLKPRWVWVENVTGLLTHSWPKGEPKKACLGAGDFRACPRCYLEHGILADLRMRYSHVGFFVVDAASFGAPQNRRRVIIWAGPSELARPTGTHMDPKRMTGPMGLLGLAFKPWVSMGEGLGLSEADLLDPSNRELFERPSPTVTASEVKGTRRCAANNWSPSGGHGRASDLLHACTGVRRVTIAQATKLQFMPDDWPWQGPKKAQYRQVGNAVPPLLSEAVVRASLEADGIERLRGVA
mgnify:FL=1